VADAAPAQLRRALLVSAHPDPRSFHAAMRAAAIQELHAQSYETAVSDLYAMDFKATLDRRDFLTTHDATALNLSLEQRHAWTHQGLAPEIASELQRLQQADLLLLLFPLWWFGMPAILKGWIDRVFVSGAVYGRNAVFERGRLRGKRALVAVTTGAPQEAFGANSLNGDMKEILMPLLKGVLGFTGMSVLQPFVAHNVPYAGQTGRAQLLSQWRAHLQSLDHLTPLPMPRLADHPHALAPEARAQ
jgi:NAD(P)H dehydrogenase (quinone)